MSLPAGEKIPPAVERVTGIRNADLDDAIAPAEAWRKLRAAGERTPVAVIHFARFERAFLGALHASMAPDEPFPIEVICTHDIAARLLPELPRRGLHALAGYFGMAVPKPRRSADHVAATAFVWRHLAARLANRGIDTAEELVAWLRDTPVPRRTRHAYPMSRARRLAVPDAPGVYRMLRASGEVLYVGKATSLRRRVNSYFQKQSKVAGHTLDMLTQARDLRVTVTETALEAALLETDEIKRCAPPYNVALVPSVDGGRDAAWVPGLGLVARPLELAADRAVAGAMATGDATAACAMWPERDPLSVCVSLAKLRAGWPTRLEELLARAAHARRRARWLARLADARVAWRLPTWSRTRVLAIVDGVVAAGAWTDAPPVGALRSVVVGSGGSDVAPRTATSTYDRLRVLTTELRRVVGEGADVAILFPAARRILAGARLERTLSWV